MARTASSKPAEDPYADLQDPGEGWAYCAHEGVEGVARLPLSSLPHLSSGWRIVRPSAASTPTTSEE